MLFAVVVISTSKSNAQSMKSVYDSYFNLNSAFCDAVSCFYVFNSRINSFSLASSGAHVQWCGPFAHQKNQASEDCCNAHICAYRPFNANRSACEPRSTMRPASNTKISCASTTVDKRCAITKVVLFCAALCNSA